MKKDLKNLTTKELQEEYKKQLNRLKNIVRRANKKDIIFADDPLKEFKRKRITKKSINLIKEMQRTNPLYIYSKGSYIDKDTGEILSTGYQRITELKNKSIKKANTTKLLNKIKSLFEDDNKTFISPFEDNKETSISLFEDNKETSVSLFEDNKGSNISLFEDYKETNIPTFDIFEILENKINNYCNNIVYGKDDTRLNIYMNLHECLNNLKNEFNNGNDEIKNKIITYLNENETKINSLFDEGYYGSNDEGSKRNFDELYKILSYNNFTSDNMKKFNENSNKLDENNEFEQTDNYNIDEFIKNFIK